ncbi:hypothetical protein D9M69_676970 [compost metagenome]
MKPAWGRPGRFSKVAAGLGPAQADSLDFFGSWAFRKAIWSARMLRFDRIRCSIQLGRYGTASNGMCACCGVRLLLRELQVKQAVTTFSQMSRPPLDSGST